MADILVVEAPCGAIARGEIRRNVPSELPLVRAYALRCATRDAAQDVVADTFLVAWRRLEEVPDEALPLHRARARLAAELAALRGAPVTDAGPSSLEVT